MMERVAVQMWGILLGHLFLKNLYAFCVSALCIVLLKYLHAAVKSHCRASEEFTGPWAGPESGLERE